MNLICTTHCCLLIVCFTDNQAPLSNAILTMTIQSNSEKHHQAPARLLSQDINALHLLLDVIQLQTARSDTHHNRIPDSIDLELPGLGTQALKPRDKVSNHRKSLEVCIGILRKDVLRVLDLQARRLSRRCNKLGREENILSSLHYR